MFYAPKGKYTEPFKIDGEKSLVSLLLITNSKIYPIHLNNTRRLITVRNRIDFTNNFERWNKIWLVYCRRHV